MHEICPREGYDMSVMHACRWIGGVGYVLFGIIGAGVIPQLYPAVKWYMVAIAFFSGPVFSVSCHAQLCKRASLHWANEYKETSIKLQE